MRVGDINWRSPAPVFAMVIAAGLIGQVYLAGLAVLGKPGGWAVHGMFGGSLAIPIIGLACYGWIGASGKVYRRPASLLLLLYLLQFGLIGAGVQMGIAWIGAFHPANALLMLIGVLDVLRRAALSSPTTQP